MGLQGCGVITCHGEGGCSHKPACKPLLGIVVANKGEMENSLGLFTFTEIRNTLGIICQTKRKAFIYHGRPPTKSIKYLLLPRNLQSSRWGSGADAAAWSSRTASQS